MLSLEQVSAIFKKYAEPLDFVAIRNLETASSLTNSIDSSSNPVTKSQSKRKYKRKREEELSAAALPLFTNAARDLLDRSGAGAAQDDTNTVCSSTESSSDFASNYKIDKIHNALDIKSNGGLPDSEYHEGKAVDSEVEELEKSFSSNPQTPLVLAVSGHSRSASAEHPFSIPLLHLDSEHGTNLHGDFIRFVSAYKYVKHHQDLYTSDSFDSIPFVDLLYSGNVTEKYASNTEKYAFDPIVDLSKSVTFMAEDSPMAFGDFDDPFDDGVFHRIERAVKKDPVKNIIKFKKLVEIFNEKLKELIGAGKFKRDSFREKTLSFDQTVILLDQVYARTVTDPDALRSYRGFSKEVYGETGNAVIHDIIKRVGIRRDHVFIDLGSGIGNVVLQVSCETRCKAFGVELLDVPAGFARQQLFEFQNRMRMYGRNPPSVHLKQGDFLEDEKVLRLIERADVVFVNNYAFEATVNQRLMQLFLGMKENAIIISFRAFRSIGYTITNHNMNDIASILTVERYTYGPGGVSWTNSPGEYFVHRVDRRELKRFIETSQNGDMESSSRHSRGSASSRNRR